jgi:Ras-related protein Rab-18
MFYDTAGQEIYNSINAIYYRNAHTVIFVYDVNSEKTFERLTHHLNEYERNRSNDSFVSKKYVVGNKIDLERKVSRDDAEKWALDNNMSYREYSAKIDERGASLSDLMEEIVENILSTPAIMNCQKSKEIGLFHQMTGKSFKKSCSC